MPTSEGLLELATHCAEKFELDYPDARPHAGYRVAEGRASDDRQYLAFGDVGTTVTISRIMVGGEAVLACRGRLLIS